ncbi:MAG: SWIM zinc finger family protein [Kiritimatiellia bacterium]
MKKRASAKRMDMAFSELTWEDLSEWAGSKVVARGKSYRTAVEDLRTTPDGQLLAWVQGGDRYATLVSLHKSGKLSSVCTCPYAIACKHAVAVVVAYLNAIQEKKPVPSAAESDERLDCLAGEVDDEDVDIEIGEEAPSAVSRYLEALSPSALLEFTRKLAVDFPDVRQRIEDHVEVESGDTAKLIANTRREIEAVSAEGGWTRHWSGECNIPDYSRVRERLECLLKSGHPDEVLLLGEDILKRGIRQIEMSNDEGETGQEIAGCMAIVFRALSASSKSASQRLLWEIDARLRDGYSILDGIRGLVEKPKAFARSDWSAVAEALSRRMDAISVAAAPRESDESSREYRRQTVMRWLFLALRHAGREREISSILEREVAITHCYVELVDRLFAEKREEAAVEWAHKGFARTIESKSGIAWQLEERLRAHAARKKDRPLATAFLAMEFFDRPDADRYEALQQAAASLGLWDTIRPLLLRWLETGIRPDEKTAEEAPQKRVRKKSTEQPETPQVKWPLPATGLVVPEGKERSRSFPDTATLMAIAMKEGRNDDVLRWYKAGRGGYGHDYQGDAVAATVQMSHPDEALAIWLRLAKAQIALTKPAAYPLAGDRLGKMKAVYQRTGRMDEWNRLLVELRVENARKPRMLEVLDHLEGKRSRILKQTGDT